MNSFGLPTIIYIVVLAMMPFCCSLDGKNRRGPGTDLDPALVAFTFLRPSEIACHWDRWHVFLLLGL